MTQSYEQRVRNLRSGTIFLDFADGRTEKHSGSWLDLDLMNLLRPQLYLTGDRTPWDKRVEAPCLVLTNARVRTSPKTPAGQGISCVSLFAATTKMRCASFSLPAGPPNLGGTCQQANRRDLIDDALIYICHNCYAIRGRYLCSSKQLVGQVLMQWVRHWLHEDPRKLIEQFINALEDYVSKPRYLDLGKKQRVAMNPNYFRIHDSGDMGWAGVPYYKVWDELARTFPKIRFWAPTRDHHNVKLAGWFRRWRPGNFTLRPSALHLQDPAPTVKGLAAGSTSAYDDPTLKPIRELAALDCPAFAGEGLHSCESANDGKGCRVCWTAPKKSINYQPHGVARKPRVKRISELRTNPGGLSALLDAWEPSLQQNPDAAGDPEVFESHLLAQGIDPGSFSPNEWEDTLRQQGMDEDQIADYISGSAEWQA